MCCLVKSMCRLVSQYLYSGRCPGLFLSPGLGGRDDCKNSGSKPMTVVLETTNDTLFTDGYFKKKIGLLKFSAFLARNFSPFNILSGKSFVKQA